MKLPTKIVWILIAVFVAIALTQIDFSSEKKAEKPDTPEEKVVEKAYHTQSFGTFVSALKTANVDEELNNGDSFTIFAPSDSAFITLPEGKYAEIMQKHNRDELKNILNYHIVPQRITTEDLKNGQVLTTIQGQQIKVSLSANEGQAKVNGLPLIKTNIEASNGIIHVIDKVMMPSQEDAKAQASLRN